MNKEFITCLEHIIDLEKMRMVQEDLLAALTDRANKLGLRNQYQKPVLKQAEHKLELQMREYHHARTLALVGGIAGTFFTLCVACSQSESRGGFSAAVAAFVGFGITSVIIIIASLIGASLDKTAAKDAVQKQFETDTRENQRAYDIKLKEYDRAVAVDAQRAKNELVVKENLMPSVYELQNQIHKIKSVLKSHYDAAGIYDSPAYRNIVAVSYFYEYLTSGICTEFGGPNGAYLTYKKEMYEILKIERLDTIVDYLDKLHHDNYMLKEAMDSVAASVNDVYWQMDTLIGQQRLAIEQGKTIQQQNALSLYNQECQQKELESLNWLSQYQAFWK